MTKISMQSILVKIRVGVDCHTMLVMLLVGLANLSALIPVFCRNNLKTFRHAKPEKTHQPPEPSAHFPFQHHPSRRVFQWTPDDHERHSATDAGVGRIEGINIHAAMYNHSIYEILSLLEVAFLEEKSWRFSQFFTKNVLKNTALGTSFQGLFLWPLAKEWQNQCN